MKNQQISEWISDNGDSTHNLNHDLDENSVIMDLGAYGGLWAYQLLEKHPNLSKANIFLIEPVPEFEQICKNNFSNFPNVKTKCVGVGLKNEFSTVNLTGDATSSSSEGDTTIELVTMENLMKSLDIEKIDLLQINIEGAEYDLLENWIESGLITKFKTLQIQFHFEGIGPKDSDERMEKIQASLSHMGYTKKFGYCYVWECWQYNDKNTEL